jgi:hypothetical protein
MDRSSILVEGHHLPEQFLPLGKGHLLTRLEEGEQDGEEVSVDFGKASVLRQFRADGPGGWR